MPKVAQDAELQERLNTFLKDRNISVAEAAKEFAVDRTALWRFSQTGRAREDRKAVYVAALNRIEQQESATLVAVNDVGPATPVRDRELRRIRQTCESVLRLLDAYEQRTKDA